MLPDGVRPPAIAVWVAPPLRPPPATARLPAPPVLPVGLPLIPVDRPPALALLPLATLTPPPLRPAVDGPRLAVDGPRLVVVGPLPAVVGPWLAVDGPREAVLAPPLLAPDGAECAGAACGAGAAGFGASLPFCALATPTGTRATARIVAKYLDGKGLRASSAIMRYSFSKSPLGIFPNLPDVTERR